MNTFIHSFEFSREPYPIPDPNGQSLYPFIPKRRKNPTLWGGTYLWFVHMSTPGPRVLCPVLLEKRDLSSGLAYLPQVPDKIKTTIYRKPTHTDRLLDQSSYNPTSHKATTIRTLTRRAQLVCDSPDSLLCDMYNVFYRLLSTLTIDDCLTVTREGSKRTNYWSWLRVFIANNITA